MKNWSHIRNVFKNIGFKNILATIIVFTLTIAATFVGGIQLYKSTKSNIVLQGEVNAKQSAMTFDRYLLVRKNTIMLLGDEVNNMLAEDRPISDILDYLVEESQSIKDSIDKDYTGLYGWIKGQYCDGVGWEPDEDYVPTERPWYTETMANDNDITFVSPYIDEQTQTFIMTLATRLKDGDSVLALDISLEQIQGITEDIAKQTPDSYCFVLDKEGLVIAHSDTKELGKNYRKESGTLGSSVVHTLYNENEHFIELSFDGQKYMVYAENLEGGWYCASLVNMAEYYRPLKIILAVLIILTVLEAAIFILTIFHFSSNNLAISIQNVQLGALGDLYLSVQDIDLNTDSIRFIRKGSGEVTNPAKESNATSAREILNEVCEKHVDETSKPVMEAFTDLSTLPDRLFETDTIAVEYLNDQSIWCRARFLVAERNADGKVVRVLWSIESIDEEKKQRDRLKLLSETDPMTGVRSKHAWLLKEKELNEVIASGGAEEFSVVICDVNGLKNINDTYGHKAGDDYIRKACRMVCDIFQHSPVFRVGGDEFTVILTDRDYALRNELMIALHDRSVDQIATDGAVISGGISDYRPAEDRSVRDVFQRADDRMYEEKKLLKSLGAVTREDQEKADTETAPDQKSEDTQSIINVKRHLLIVDDEDVNRDILGAALGNGYELLFAADGYEALEQVRAHKDNLALILLDLIMPRLSGQEVLKVLKNEDELKDIPVIVITTDQDAELECLNLGAMDFIRKPYPQWEIVRARINKCIELSEGREMIRATERDDLTTLFNIDYFFRYVKMYDQNYWDMPMDAVVVDVNHFRSINKRCGKQYADKLLGRIGERVRSLARKLGGVGSRRGADTFLIYWPHQEDYPELLERLSGSLAEDEDSDCRIKLRMGVYSDVDKKQDIKLRFDNAKLAADAIDREGEETVGYFKAES